MFESLPQYFMIEEGEGEDYANYIDWLEKNYDLNSETSMLAIGVITHSAEDYKNGIIGYGPIIDKSTKRVVSFDKIKLITLEDWSKIIKNKNMTNRVKGFTITLDNDTREDEIEEIMIALRMIKGVIHVESSIANSGDQMVKQRVKLEYQQKFLNFYKDAFE